MKPETTSNWPYVLFQYILSTQTFRFTHDIFTAVGPRLQDSPYFSMGLFLGEKKRLIPGQERNRYTAICGARKSGPVTFDAT
jgi:hypothetical protein